MGKEYCCKFRYMTHRHESGCQKVATLATNAGVANDLPERHVFYWICSFPYHFTRKVTNNPLKRLDKDLLKQRKYLFGTGEYVRSSTGVYAPEDDDDDDDDEEEEEEEEDEDGDGDGDGDGDYDEDDDGDDDGDNA